MSRPIGLAPLSALSVPPDRLVRYAAAAGFDFVGLRVRMVTKEEAQFDLSPGSPLMASTVAALEETGLHVVDTEFLQVNADTNREDWMTSLEAGAALGARTYTVAAGDDDLDRLTDTLGRLVEDAAQFGISPSLEPISYRSVHSLPLGAKVARAAGARLLPDTLHLARFGGIPEELTEFSDLIDMIQLCDSPTQRPADLAGLIEESRSIRLAPGDGHQDLASYVQALDPNLPVSVEVPNEPTVAKIGAEAWINHLYTSTRELLAVVATETASESE